MLSFKSGKTPIAIIKGGKLNNELIFINNPNNKKEQIQEIEVHDGKIIVFPDPSRATRMYTGGPSGSGKSTTEANWVRQYSKMNPDNKIFLFKRDDDFDPAYIGIDIEDRISPKTDLNELSDSMLIFDDIAEIQDEVERVQTNFLLKDALKNGRKKNISVACSNHLLYDGNRTKDMLYQCDKLIIFPGSSNYMIENLCKKYVGMGKKAIDRLLSLPSRWVMISKKYPQYVVYETGAYIL